MKHIYSLEVLASGMVAAASSAAMAQVTIGHSPLYAAGVYTSDISGNRPAI